MLPAYAIASAVSLVALAGAIGLIEMIYFLSTTTTRDSAMILYGIALDAADFRPWLICIALTAAGVCGCVRAYPRMAEVYNSALHEARRQVAS
jgi:membrane protein DedA with SNARE-associated domain